MGDIKDRILIVEDERNISNFMETILVSNDYETLTASNGAEAYTIITSHRPDLVILDLGLPDIDGLELIKMVREWTQMPIIVVSARTQERDKVDALDLGADDYITKPFGTSELLARIRTGIRHIRNQSSNEEIIQTGCFKTGGLVIDYDKHRVYIDNENAGLTQIEYRIVSLLGKYAGKVLTYDFILNELWGPGAKGNNQILRVNMANIRRKIENNPAEPVYIFTEVGVGYIMSEGE